MKTWIFFILMCQLVSASSVAQNFTYHSSSPFGIQVVKSDTTRAAQKISFYDYDYDGDLDLLLSGLDAIDQVDTLRWENIHFFMELQENIGDKWNPVFEERISVFEDFPYPVGYFLPSPGDLNADGASDFLAGADINFIGNQTFLYLQNTGGPEGFEFMSTRLDSMELPDFVPESFFTPDLVDLDLDGDLDILMSGYIPAFGEENGQDEAVYYYARNVGTQNTPEFQGWYVNPYGLIPNPFIEITTSGDIDNDGDVDLLGSTLDLSPDSNNYLFIHLNSPEKNGKPSFNSVLESPFGLPAEFGENQFLAPDLADIDGDGDQDLFVFLSTPDTFILKYYENSLCTTKSSDMLVSLCEGDAFKLGGNTYTEAGDFTIHLQGSDGCDSIVFLTIEVIPPTEVSLNESICEGETFTIGNETFSVPGDYTVFIAAANGCDSVVFLSLVVDPLISVSFNLTICEGESVTIYNETFTQAGDYTLIVPATIGCDTIILLSLTVYPHALVNLHDSICEGETFFVGNESFSVSGNYVITLTGANGCDSIVTLELQVKEVDNAVTVNQNTITVNETGATYQWFDCDSGDNIPGATNQSYEATATGNYAVRITLSGCSAVSECVSIIISGIEEDALFNSISLYPNPSSGLIYLRNTSRFPVTSFTVINLSGQILGEITINEKNGADISFLGKGVYVIKLNIDGMAIIKRLIVM